jgi:cytochrome P450
MTTPDVTAARLPWDAADPYPFYEARRRGGDVVWDDTAHGWLVLGYHAAREVLAGPGWISDPRANRATGEALKFLNPQYVDASMLFADGLPHVRLRGAVRDVFTRSFISGLTDGVESICADAAATAATGEDFDVMSQIALPLPIAVIGA